jgi:hypothetical protein
MPSRQKDYSREACLRRSWRREQSTWNNAALWSSLGDVVVVRRKEKK